MDLKNRLYISDMDQTLLQSDAKLTPFAIKNLNNIIEKGVNFTVASARSVKSQQPILEEINLKLPVIEFNGSFISELKSGNHLVLNELAKETLEYAAGRMDRENLHYFVSTYDGVQDRLHYSEVTNPGEDWYVRDRIAFGDSRLHKTGDRRSHFTEHVVCLTVIDRLERLNSLEQELGESGDAIEIHIQENQYTPGWYWLTVHSAMATKDQAIEKLCQTSGLEGAFVTAFGDNSNDIRMLREAHCGVAVGNAMDMVKKAADRVIGPNSEDSVIRYIAEDCGVELI